MCFSDRAAAGLSFIDSVSAPPLLIASPEPPCSRCRLRLAGQEQVGKVELRWKPQRVAGSEVKFHVNVSIVTRNFVNLLRRKKSDEYVTAALGKRTANVPPVYPRHATVSSPVAALK
ncbi:hypothetical protein E2C01_049973 [Portunus trituberculatus]|uniref:Uncharacterized protein n=1 Tax=Portunus trituberculatus TaxID=210409 RepID=A0A5B7GHJ6_PORTR|nr:hypothetical protein [Portunus trituberculatus]